MSSLPPPSPVVAPGPAPVVAPAPEQAGAPDASTGTAVGTPIDLDRIAQDLADVEVALERLDEGRYWTCEVTGEPLPDDLLAADPVARRRPSAAGSAPAGSAPTTSASPETATATW
jgi:hypothetical protein